MDTGTPLPEHHDRIVAVKRIEAMMRERNKLEIQLRQSQKMEAIGTLAGGIAHDFNNILGAIIAFTELARLDAGDNQAVQDCLKQVLKAGDRAKGLVQQILSFSRQNKVERRVVLLQPIVKEVLKLMGSTLPASIEVGSDIRPDAGTVLADTTQIHQVLVNLCTNAAHAMRGQNGRLEVRLDETQVDEALAHTQPDLRPGKYVRLTVSDNGHGMDAATLSRIFEPFFTTKGPGEGTGLGLSVVHGIMQDHEGAIQVASQPGCGTVFQLFFPLHLAALETKLDSRLDLPAGSGQRVLYVDDEPALCLAAEGILKKFNYRVTTYTEPLFALEHFLREPASFDVVLADLNMPGLTGVELGREILVVRPEIPVLLISGFSGTWNQEKVRSLGLRDLIVKPISSSVLLQAIHEALMAPDGMANPRRI